MIFIWSIAVPLFVVDLATLIYCPVYSYAALHSLLYKRRYALDEMSHHSSSFKNRYMLLCSGADSRQSEPFVLQLFLVNYRRFRRFLIANARHDLPKNEW